MLRVASEWQKNNEGHTWTAGTVMRPAVPTFVCFEPTSMLKPLTLATSFILHLHFPQALELTRECHGNRRLLLQELLGQTCMFPVHACWQSRYWCSLRKIWLFHQSFRFSGNEGYECHPHQSLIKQSWEYCKIQDYKAVLLFETCQAKMAWEFYRTFSRNVLVFFI